MGEQLKLPLGRLSSQQFSPVDTVARGAREYARSQGRSYSRRGLATTQVNPRTGFAIQKAYRDSMARPTPAAGIEDSYKALRQDLHSQYDFMTRPKEAGGMGLRHEVVPHDPYATPEEMAHDVRGGRIQTLASQTTSTVGSSTGRTEQALTDEENDKFRAVHDVFGHAGIGRGFSRHGEEAAWRSHIQMFSPEARPAATSELRGQNSYLNYSPQGGFPDTGGRMVGLPDWAQKTKFKDRRQERPRGTGVQQKLF